ncbi:MAG: non-hydrolyzing UDP-N-acetylglucosamine 2-epimerase [Gammaproteobacteria bacterium]
MKLLLVAGARPNFMKIAPVIREIRRRPAQFDYVLVHTGQHYDEGMSDVFFRDLEIPAPHHHLEVGSGSHAAQTAAIMTKFEPVLSAEKPDCVMVFGDVNSTLACSIVAKKLCYPVAHVEAGLRSGDMAMPEEINRIVTDSITDFFFVTEPSGVRNLAHEGKDAAQVFHVGHVMIDNLFFEVERLDREGLSMAATTLKPASGEFGVMTLHRPSNVDDPATLRGIFEALATVAARLPLIFPVHPRTRSSMERHGLNLPAGITAVPPLGYREFLDLWRDARLVLTDSGGLQEESTALGVPCLTLRHNTERPVTVEEGTNRLVGSDPGAIVEAAMEVLARQRGAAPARRPALWDGKASERILDHIAEAAPRAPA